uniref:Chloride channel protein n=1 Tax=Strigamia maritima TaxID=126957 RepID=T1IQB2_STRMM
MTSHDRRGISFSSEVEFGGTSLYTSSWFVRIKRFLWSDWEAEQGIQMQRPGEVLTEPDEMQQGFTIYDDFHTIDWVKDLSRDRRRHRFLELHRRDTWRKKLGFLWDSGAAWICVSLVGLLCGCVSAFLDIGTGWMVDLKSGFCKDAFWFNQEQCCWMSNSSSFDDGDCEEWTTWAELLGATKETQTYYLQYLSYVLLGGFMASLAGFFVQTFAPYAGGGGIPELKTVLSGFIIRGLLGKWTLIIKLFGVMLAVASGLVLGKEAPLVHIACCIGNIVSRFFPKYCKNEAKKREILSAAAAAGVSVAFGAPIGGVLFSLEEVSYYFPPKTLWRTFFCAMVAAFVLSTINPFGNDHMIVFYVEYKTPWIIIEIFPFVFLGALGGIFAAAFIKANVFWCKLRKETALGKYPIVEVTSVALLTALLSFPNPFTRMETTKLITLLVRDCGKGHSTDLCDYYYIYDNRTTPYGIYQAGQGVTNASILLVLAFIVKLCMMMITVGMKIPAGLYIPSLAIGAIMGRLVGIGVEQIFYFFPILGEGLCSEHCIMPGLYGMVGAAAFLGGVTRMTVGLVVIMFEVTGGVRYILPLMLAVMTSKWVGDALCKNGIFEELIELNKYPFLDIKEEVEKLTVAADVRQPKDGETFTLLTQDGMTVGQLEKILMECTFNGFPIVVSEEGRHLFGFVLRRDLVLALDHAKRTKSDVDQTTLISFADMSFQDENHYNIIKMKKIVNMATITVTDVTPMETITDIFRKLGLRHLLVADKGTLLGIITKKDLLHHLKDH